MFFFKKDCKVTLYFECSSFPNFNSKTEDIKEIISKTGTNLYTLLIENNIISQSVCQGKGGCGKCMVRFLDPIPTPTKQEINLISKQNLEIGYRLACLHTLKKNIVLDMSSTIKKKDREIEEEVESGTISINDFAAEESDIIAPNLIESDATDGILLIQQASGIRYYLYSAALDSIVAESLYQTQEKLSDIVDNDGLPDFLHSELKIRDIERILVILEGHDGYNAITKLDMFRYICSNIGMQQIELIMPRGKNIPELAHFFRILNLDIKNNKKNLIISLDSLSMVHYFGENSLVGMHFPFLNSNTLAIMPKKNNAIISIDDKLCPILVEDKSKPIDGLTFTAFLQAIKLLESNGIIDKRYQIRSRVELNKRNIPLDIIVRIASREGSNGFYIYQDKFSEVLITQKMLDTVFQIKAYIRSIIDYTRKNIGNVSNIIIASTLKHDNLMSLLLDLEIIPQDFQNKLFYQPGDALVQAVRIFSEPSLEIFIERRFTNNSVIELIDDEDFKRFSSAHVLQIL